jgi:F0F1-type ATP synthase assembly protein I
MKARPKRKEGRKAMKAIVAIVQMFLLFKGIEALLGFPVAMGWLVADRITSLLAVFGREGH